MNFPCLGVDFSEILLVWVFALRFCLLGFELPVLGVFGDSAVWAILVTFGGRRVFWMA